MTESERLFEEFCAGLGICLERIETRDNRTPDYRIWPLNAEVVCEVKQIEANAKERRALSAAVRGEYIVTGGIPGSRVRRKITDASPQLRNLAKGRCPALLVLSAESFLRRHLDEYQVRVAMYGLDTIIMGVPRNTAARAYAKDRKSGPKRKMSTERNTSISAILELRRHRDHTIHCTVYHNKFAAIPLPHKLLDADHVRHLRLRKKAAGEFDEWEQM
jgi:hypothetical protein